MKYLDAMLAEAAPIDQMDRLIDDDLYLAEQKIDGHRCLMHIEGGRIAPVARSGMLLDGVKPPVLDAFGPFLDSAARWVFDGEYLAGCYYVFDLIEAGGMITPTMPLDQRRMALEHFWDQWAPRTSSIAILPAARDAEAKRSLVQRVRDVGGEGVMFKRKDSIYVPGKRSASVLKLKFRNEVDCFVWELGAEGKQNMTLAVYDENGDVHLVGECTRLAGDGQACRKDDVVTVLYQYASNNRRLVQPTKPRLRTDKKPNECTIDQLVYVNKTVLT